MYDGCFGLNRRPFASVPQIEHYFPATAIEGARATLTRCIQRGEGTGLVVGPSGTGKTLLCLLLAEQFRRSFQVVMLSTGRLSTRRALFQAILYELGQPYRGLDEGEARLAVIDYLMADESGSRGVVLLVDEAHTLPLRLLEEIRMLTNLTRTGQPLVRAVLAGGPALEERFASPKLDSFSQRLSARCYLESLNRTESESFIRSQIDSAGGLGEHVFPTETCQTVFQATGGVPRLINQVCDHALLLAYVAGEQQIEPSGIEEAWADLQQLPAPLSESKNEETSGVIEFGSLDDSGEEVGTSSTIAVSLPALRITPEEEEEEGEGEPVRQICRIEKLLAEADDGFEPAGSIGPEIELCFEDASHPFLEEFEHEEVVADRYAVAPAPQVEISDVAPAIEPEPIEPESVELDESAFYETSDSVGMTPEVDLELVAAQVGASEREEFDAADRLESSKPSPPTLAPSAPTQPREYRRLFARLRQG
jgi:type II secretory pathway predicted ATPase ExeA